MTLNIAQVIGLNTDQKAAQVISSSRDGENTFLAVLELACDDAFTKGRQALSELEDFYFEGEGTPGDRLNAAFAEAEKKFAAPSQADFCLAAISGKALYIIGRGMVEVYLKRDGKLAPLFPAGSPSQLISGFIDGGDRLLLATKSMVNFLGPEMEKALGGPVETFEEELGAKLGASDLEDKGLAALAIEIAEEDPGLSPVEKPPAESQFEPAGGASSAVKVLVGILLERSKNVTHKLKEYFPKSGRGRLILASVMLVVIFLGAGYKYLEGRDREKKVQAERLLSEAREEFSAAKAVASLNPGEAKNKLEVAKEKINQALSLKSKDKEVLDFKNQLESEYTSILKAASVSEFPLFLDLDLIKKGMRSKYLSLSAGKLLILDSDLKTLAVVDLVKKSNQILAGSDNLGQAQLASLNGGLAFVYSQDKGILRVDSANSKVSTVAKKDEEWGKIVDLYGFAGNVYALDAGKTETPQSGQIWKYISTSEGYSDKRSYLTKGTTADFGSALRMQIESSIYVLKSGGEILRFTKGEKDHFALGGLDKGVKDPKSFFVSSETDNLYLLDSGNSRLVIVSKTGEYKGQMEGDKFSSASDLAVDEKGKKVYLLEGSKIFQVDLK